MELSSHGLTHCPVDSLRTVPLGHASLYSTVGQHHALSDQLPQHSRNTAPDMLWPHCFECGKGSLNASYKLDMVCNFTVIALLMVATAPIRCTGSSTASVCLCVSYTHSPKRSSLPTGHTCNNQGEHQGSLFLAPVSVLDSMFMSNRERVLLPLYKRLRN